MSASALPITGDACCNPKMLTGEALGAAIKAAMKAKGVTQHQVAAHFGVRQSSVSEWCKYGRVSKARLPQLFAYFSDVASIESWGLYPTQHQATVVDASEPSAADVARHELHQLIESLDGDEKLLAEAASFLTYLSSRRQLGELSPDHAELKQRAS